MCGWLGAGDGEDEGLADQLKKAEREIEALQRILGVWSGDTIHVLARSVARCPPLLLLSSLRPLPSIFFSLLVWYCASMSHSHLRAHMTHLRALAVLRTEESQRARAEQDELTHKIRDYHQLFEEEKQERYAIACDMTRQYKNMQDVLIDRIVAGGGARCSLAVRVLTFFCCCCLGSQNDLEEGIHNLRDQLGLLIPLVWKFSTLACLLT